MGKKEKFIDKANSQKFHLLHRSLRDEAHASIEVPSTFVLVPAVDNGNNNSNNNGGGGRHDAQKRSAAEKLAASKDHINELGFANDGYDYSQHLREIGSGGTFISKTGQTGTPLDLSLISKREGVPVELPEECMPSEKNLDKHYEAITINHNLMDQDIRAALFDGFDDEGNFEELDDDFVSQVINGPENDDFDFDAHIAKLIARSEQTLHIPNANREKGKVCFADYPEDEEDDEEFPDYLVDEADFHQYATEREIAGGGGGAVNPLSAEARAALEAQFDRTLEEYEDEEIGYLEELEEEDFGGTIDFHEDGNLLDGVLDEFLQDKKDNIFSEGTKLRKGERSSIIDPKLLSGASADSSIEENANPTEVDVQKELSEQIALQEETEAVLRRMRQDALNKDTSIETCQEYLQEVRIDDQWDCETILSTYSTLDNHPTLIKDKNTKFRKYKSPHERALEAEAAGSCARSSAGSVASRSLASSSVRNKTNGSVSGSIYGTSSSLTNKGPISAPGKIVLSGRLNLPAGFGPAGYEKRKDQTQSQRSLESLSASTVSSVATATVRRNGRDERLGEIAEGEGEEESDSENSRKTGDDEDDSFDERKQNRSIARKRRNETAEEKKARKDAVKEERRAKRTSKKELRSVFKAEGTKMIRSVGNEQSIDHVSVFKYT